MSTYIPGVGDRVRRLTDRHTWGDNAQYLPAGTVVTVTRLWGSEPSAGFLDENGVSHGARYVELVELVEPAAAAAATPTITAGSRVRRTTGNNGRKYPGDEFIVREVRHDGFIIDDNGEAHNPRYIELVESATVIAAELTPSTPETFDSYDPRMLPMFKRIADAATRAGHCREFDELAAVVGVPSREEIARLTAPPAPTEPGLYVSASLTRDGQVYTLTAGLTLYKRISISTDTWWEIRTSSASGVREVSASDLPSDLVRLVVAS